MARMVPVFSGDNSRDAVTDIYSRLLQKRIILFEGEVDSHSASLITAQLLVLRAESDSIIYLYINSGGGSVYDMLTIIDVINTCKTIATICWGLCASAAAVILSCGTKGHRYSYPHSSIMIHQPSLQTGGKYSDVLVTLKQVERLNEVSDKILAKNTGQTPSQIREKGKEDFYMSAEEAKEFGIIDHIIGSTLPTELQTPPANPIQEISI